jgi:hypothetical protein
MRVPQHRRDEVFDQWQARAEAVVSCTEPIYRRNANGRIELFGSGLLMRYGSQYFILSAAHVLAGGGERWVGGEHSRISLSGVFHIGGAANARQILKDIDIAISPLSARAVAVLGDARFLALADVEPRGAPSIGALFYAVGYPSNRALPFREDERLRARWFAVGAKAAPQERYREAGMSESTHLVLDFDRQQTEGREGSGPAPKLNGMSGGGVWRVGAEPGTDRLAAIFTEYRERESSYIVATRIDLLVGGISAYAAGELAPELARPQS